MYLDKDRAEHVELKMLTPKELIHYGAAAGTLGLKFTVLADGTDVDTRIAAGQTYAEYADKVNGWRREQFGSGVSHLDPDEHRFEADQGLGYGNVLVELAASDIEPLRQLPDELRRLQIAGEQSL